MAKHMQDQILAAVRGVLMQAGTIAGEQVRIEGVDLLAAAKTPALEIEAGEETVELLGNGRNGRRTQQRDFRVEVHCLVASNGDYRNQASELLAQVEEALNGPSLTHVDVLVPERIRLLGSRPEHDGRGNQIVYRLRSVWLCRYITTEGAPRAPVSSSN